MVSLHNDSKKQMYIEVAECLASEYSETDTLEELDITWQAITGAKKHLVHLLGMDNKRSIKSISKSLIPHFYYDPLERFYKCDLFAY